jgi:hypothetical protein
MLPLKEIHHTKNSLSMFRSSMEFGMTMISELMMLGNLFKIRHSGGNGTAAFFHGAVSQKTLN